MKKQFIGAMRPGDAIEDVFALAEKSLGKKKDGNPYLNLTLSDKTGRTRAVAWDRALEYNSGLATGTVVHVRGSASEYNGALQIVVKDMAPAPPEQTDPLDYIPKTPRNVDVMFDRLLKLTDSIKHPHLKQLLFSFWNDPDFGPRFKLSPGAKTIHHGYLGGLLEHSLSMALLVDKIAGHYGGIDMDLLKAGAMLHDIGKVRELKYGICIEYSDEGRLLNHIVLGCQMVQDRISEIENFPEEHAKLLKHMIVSHHGTREFGSPEIPKTVEAILLNFIDEIDSKVNAVRDFIKTDESGESWTNYYRIMGRQFYRGHTQSAPDNPSNEKDNEIAAEKDRVENAEKNEDEQHVYNV